MQIAFHIGAHFTDDDRLIRTLLRNRGTLVSAGVAVPGPTRYRALLADLAARLDGAEVDPETEAALIEQILEGGDRPERLVLSDQDVMGPPFLPGTGGQLYPLAVERTRSVLALMPGQDIELFLAIRSAATFLPSLIDSLSQPTGAEGETDEDTRAAIEAVKAIPPQTLDWSELVARLAEGLPDVGLSVWSDEDTPLFWPGLLRSVAGLPPNQPLEGIEDYPVELIGGKHGNRMRAALSALAPGDGRGWHNVVMGTFDRHGGTRQMLLDVNLPGWDEIFLAELEGLYDADLRRILHVPGVRLMLP